MRSYMLAPGIGVVPSRDMPDYIISKVCEYFNITPEAMKTRTRKMEFRYPRQIAMTLIREYTKLSFANIGYVCGGFDHASAMHAKKQVNNIISTSPKDKEMYRCLEANIKNAVDDIFKSVLDKIGEQFNVSAKDILSPERSDETYPARCAAIYIMMDVKKLPFSKLRRVFSCLDGDLKEALSHRVSLSWDKEYYNKVEKIKKEVKNSTKVAAN